MDLAQALEFYSALRWANLKPDTIESIIGVSSMNSTEKRLLSSLNREQAKEGRKMNWQNLMPFVLGLQNSDYALIHSGALIEYPLQIGKIYPN